MANNGRQRRRTEPTNKKVEVGMGRGMTLSRVYITKESDARLGRIADIEGRTKQRQMGIWLERLAALADDDNHRAKLRELGLISPIAAA